MRVGKNEHGNIPEQLSQLATAVAGRAQPLGVLIFTLDTRLPFTEVAEHLAEQFADLQLNTSVAACGPDRVRAVLDGKFTDRQVLVVLGEHGQTSEDALMDLVEWLLANGRKSLAENLVFAVLGHEHQDRPAPSFNRVLLPRSYYARTRQSGLRLPWAASARDSWELAEAVLDYAAGLGAE